MNLQQLKYFSDLADTLNYSKSAERLFISQSALSMSISKLEQELGFDLFCKDGRQIRLTKSGRILLKHIRAAMRELSEGVAEARAALDMAEGQIAFAFSFNGDMTFAAPLVEQFVMKHPKIKFEFSLKNPDEITEQLKCGALDYGILPLSGNYIKRNNLEYKPLMDQQIYVLISAASPLAARLSVSITELLSETYLITSGFDREWIEQCMTDVGLTECVPEFRYVPLIDQIILSMVARGEGVYITANSNMWLSAHTGVAVIRLLERKAQSYGLVWPKQQKPAQSHTLFREFVVEYNKNYAKSVMCPPRQIFATTYYYPGGSQGVSETYERVPTKVIVHGDYLVDFMVYFGLAGQIYAVTSNHYPSSLGPEYQKAISSLPVMEISTAQLLYAANHGADFLLTSNPSVLRETIFAEELEGLNSLGIHYFYANLGGTNFSGEEYESLNPQGRSKKSYCTWEDFYSTYYKLGILFRVESQVEQFVTSQMEVIHYFQERAQKAAFWPRTVFLYQSKDIFFAGYNTEVVSLMVRTCGGIFWEGLYKEEVCCPLGEAEERLLREYDPDVIIIRTAEDGLTPFTEFEQFQELSAVKNGRVYTSTQIPWTSNTASLFVAGQLAEIARFLHPDWFYTER